MANKKIGDYLKYAFGEVILVVIGILIAVTLNNWNEQRKSDNEIHAIYKLTVSDLKNDIKSIDELLAHYDSTEEFYQKHLNSEVVAEHYADNDWRAFFILGYPELKLNQRAYNLLEKFNKSTESQKDKVSAEIIGFYTDMLHEVEVDDVIRSENFKKNFSHWQSYPWWSDYITRKDYAQFIEYALTDRDYKNRVATTYFINYKVFKPEIEEYREKAISLIELIDNES